MSSIKNCIFARQLKTFFYWYNTFGNNESDRDLFHEKVIQIIREGEREGERVKIAIMQFLCKNGMRKESVKIALKMEMPKHEWTSVMKMHVKEIEEAEREFAAWYCFLRRLDFILLAFF